MPHQHTCMHVTLASVHVYVSILLLLLLVLLQAVADAELDGDEDMLAITASHASKYAVHLIREAASMVCMPSKVCAGHHRRRCASIILKTSTLSCAEHPSQQKLQTVRLVCLVGQDAVQQGWSLSCGMGHCEAVPWLC